MHTPARSSITLTLAGLIVLWVPQTAVAQSKTAGETFKNVTQLKDIPAEQLMPSMQLISIDLGVECSFCHVQGKMDSDDKGPKKTARAMMAMTAEINKTHFGGRQQMTCYSCHRGAPHPMNTPAVLESDMAPTPHVPPVAAASEAPAPTVDQILAKYVAALGGADAIHRVSSRIMKGSIAAMGSDTPIEILTKAPNKRITITHGAKGDSFTAYDGEAGWMGSTGRPAREMSSAESGAFALDAEFYLALRIKELFPQLRRGRPETIGGALCETLIGSGPGHPPVRLYFDQSTGLLTRMVRYAETPVGRNPTQIDYSDYRAVDGVKTPYRWTLSRPNGRFTIQITDVTNNASIDDGRFAKTVAH
ncbi:MAG TPA: c-type cytochrome [Bryobacteraceae bacterium]|jgi:outer membrane lipoprotein-sorting protein